MAAGVSRHNPNRRPVPDTQPLISIVLPVHNGARYLAESVESCLQQTWQNLELIIVNDGSTDATHEMVMGFQDPRVRYIQCHTNVKLPSALNVGFAAARGEYLTWTSDDNRYQPDALAKMAAVLQMGADFVYTHYRKIDPEGRVMGLWRAGPPDYLSEFNAVGACFLYRREVYRKVGNFDPGAFLVEDYDYWLRVWRQGFRMRLLAEPLYEYRDQPESLGRRHGADEVSRRRDQIRSRHVPALTRRVLRAARLLRKGMLLVFDRVRLAEERRAGFTVPLDAPATGRN